MDAPSTNARVKKIVAYIDVDDTLIRSVGKKRIPIPSVIGYVRRLHGEGAELYCWSTGGAEYAREVAGEIRLDDCFVAFLPKPNLIVDDQTVAEWRSCSHVLPANC